MAGLEALGAELGAADALDAGRPVRQREPGVALRTLGGAERPEVLTGEDLPDALGLRAVRGVGEDLRELRGLERLAALRACADSKIAKLAF